MEFIAITLSKPGPHNEYSSLVDTFRMYALSNRITRRFRDAYRTRKRSGRSNKDLELEERIQDVVEDLGMSTPVSEASGDAVIQPGISPAHRESREQRSSREQSHVAETSSPGPELASTTKTDSGLSSQGGSEVEALSESLDSPPPVEDDEYVIFRGPPAGEEPQFEEPAQLGCRDVTFSGEDEDDYTLGFPRFVNTHDGVSECAAILLTLDLSQRIQEAIQYQRVYEQIEQESGRLDKVDSRFERQLRSQIQRHERQLRNLKKQDEPDTEELASAEGELEKLTVLMDGTRTRRQGHEARVKDAAKTLRELQTNVSAYLENIFVNALLLDPRPEEHPQSPLPDLTVDGEYERLCHQLQEDHEGDFEPLHHYDLPVQPAPALSPEEQAVVELREAYWEADRRLQEAQTSFLHREAEREMAKLRTDQPSEVFDVEWLAHEQQLTRTFIDAEEAEAKAKTAALEGGVRLCDIDPDVPSTFADPQDVVEGYNDLEEQRLIETVSRPKIGAWLDGVPSAETSPAFASSPDVEEAEGSAVDDVGLCDSLSVVAEGPERSMIDKWRKMCGN